MDMVLTKNPSIDEDQIMIFIEAGDPMYGFEDSHSSPPMIQKKTQGALLLLFFERASLNTAAALLLCL
jgi:hypothetical protein